MSSTNDFTIVSGFVDVQVPGTSLAALRKQFAGVDTDRLELTPHWPEKLERLRPKTQKFRKSIAATEIVLDGLDGAYQCRVSIRAETPAPIAAPRPLSQTGQQKKFLPIGRTASQRGRRSVVHDSEPYAHEESGNQDTCERLLPPVRGIEG